MVHDHVVHLVVLFAEEGGDAEVVLVGVEADALVEREDEPVVAHAESEHLPLADRVHPVVLEEPAQEPARAESKSIEYYRRKGGDISR